MTPITRVGMSVSGAELATRVRSRTHEATSRFFRTPDRGSRIPAAILVCGLLSLAPSASAQSVTVEQLVAVALERAPELQTARTEIGAANSQVIQAGLKPNPALLASHEHEPGGMMITTLGVQWPLDLFRRPARLAVARGNVDVVSLSVRDRERLLASAIREQAGRVLASRRTLEVTNEALVAARRMRELLDRRVTEGGSPQLDANLAAVEALRLEAEAALADGEFQAATIELKALAGLTPDATLALSDSLEALAGSPMVPRMTPMAALEARPDLREAVARISLAEARADKAERDARSDVSMIAGYGRNSLTFPQLGFDQRGALVPIQNSFHAFTIGATVTLPISNRNEGAVAAAQAERQGAEALFAARQRAARADIDAAVARDREAQRAVALYAGDVRMLARQNVEVMLEGYDLGRFPLSEVLAEQRRYLDVEAGYTAVLARAYSARTALTRAFGDVP